MLECEMTQYCEPADVMPQRFLCRCSLKWLFRLQYRCGYTRIKYANYVSKSTSFRKINLACSRFVVRNTSIVVSKQSSSRNCSQVLVENKEKVVVQGTTRETLVVTESICCRVFLPVLACTFRLHVDSLQVSLLGAQLTWHIL